MQVRPSSLLWLPNFKVLPPSPELVQGPTPTVHRVALGKEEWVLSQKYQAVVAGPDKHFTRSGKMLKEELWW